MDKAIVKEMQVQQQILDLLTSNRSYQQTVSHYNKKGIYVDIWFEAKSNNIYDVALVTQDWVNNRSIAIERAHYHIDLQTRKIKPLAFNSLAASYFTHE